MEESDNIPLTSEEVEKIRKILNATSFEEFVAHKHFYRDKFTGGMSEVPRHNISWADLKKVYEKRDSLKRGFKRKVPKGYSYTLCYEESKNVFVKIGYFFDETPMKIFMGLRIFRNLERAVKKRYGINV